MKHLLDEFIRLGGKMELGYKVENLADFCFDGPGARFDVVVNCTGIGAKEIVTGDTNLHPIRGQILAADNKWLTTVLINETTGCYLIPKYKIQGYFSSL